MSESCHFAVLAFLKTVPVMLALLIILVSAFVPTCCIYMKRTNKIRRIAESAIKLVFGGILKRYRSKEGVYCYIIFNYKVPYEYTFLLFGTLVGLFALAIVQFWNEFLLEETFDCTVKGLVCCYDLTTTFPQSLDCSDTSNTTSVICYRYVFKLGTATGLV